MDLDDLHSDPTLFCQASFIVENAVLNFMLNMAITPVTAEQKETRNILLTQTVKIKNRKSMILII